MEHGTTIKSVGVGGGREWLLTLDIEQAILGYRGDIDIVLYVFNVSFLDGQMPCFKCAQTQRRWGQSFWMLNHAGLLVNGRRSVLSKMS